MNEELDRLFTQIEGIENDIERKLDAHRAQFKYRIANGKAVFEAQAQAANKRLRAGLWPYLTGTEWRTFLVAPVIYAMVVPFALLDFSLTVFQWICFSAWGIRHVARRDYVVIDRQRLGYLNAIEKLNCVYCGYGNGVIAYGREIAARTEQYWCPIRHATRVLGAHGRYRDFADYGDADAYRARLAELRAKLR